MGDNSAGVANAADGEQMATNTQRRGRTRPWWRPLAYSAATAAAIASLFNPLPAAAAPEIPPPAVPAVPDPGSRPIPLGTLAMPGQNPAPAAGATTATPGVAMTPLMQKIEKQRAEIAALGDKLIKLGEDRDLAQQQATTAAQKATDAQTALVLAEKEAAAAAAAALRDQAALPPGTLGSGLADLGALSRMQRGESASEEAAARHLAIVRAAHAAALVEQATATTNATDFGQQYDTLNADIAKKQAALQKLEQRHADEITAAEAAESAEDRRLGAGYLDGTAQGRGADPRAVAALTFALAQRGDPYVWSEEGPDQYDCSGLMYAAYRSSAAGNFPLMRVSRDQYYQTRNKVVDRYSLLAGDLLFFSSTNSWTGIHHVAMYAGDGMMVEAPRSGLHVRLVPVRWSRLFQATRIYGSVDGSTAVPDLNAPPPSNGGTTTTNPTTKPSSKPPTQPSSKPPTSPSSTPSTSPSSTPSTSPSSTPSTSPSSTPTSSSGSPSATPSSTGEPPTSPTPTSPSTSDSGSPTSTSTGSSSSEQSPSQDEPTSEPTSESTSSSSTSSGSTSSGSTSSGSTSSESTSSGSTSSGSTSSESTSSESTSSGSTSSTSTSSSTTESTSASTTASASEDPE